MATLHIEHKIDDFAIWKAAFDRFTGQRREAGVTAYRIYQPQDDAAYVILQLDFPSIQQAQAFLGFLEARVWSTPRTLPDLRGVPKRESWWKRRNSLWN